MNAKTSKLQTKLKRNIGLDYFSTFITNLNMQSSIWVLYLAYCGLNLAEIGLLEGIYHATSILCEIPSGAVADLLGRKRSMVLSRVCIAVSCMLMLFSGSFGLFALSFIVQALGNNFNSGSEEALVYDSMKYIGQEERAAERYFGGVPGDCHSDRRHPRGILLSLVLWRLCDHCGALPDPRDPPDGSALRPGGKEEGGDKGAGAVPFQHELSNFKVGCQDIENNHFLFGRLRIPDTLVLL